MATSLTQQGETLSIVVPCFNEEEAIPLFYEEMTRVLKHPLLSSFRAEIIFVDDGSSDGTLSVIEGLLSDERIKYVSLSRNFGKESAMAAGLESAKGDYVAVMDVDLQDPPSLLPEMLLVLLESENGEGQRVDMVRVRRTTRDKEPMFRSFASNAFYYFMNKMSETEVPSGARDYMLMRRRCVNALLEMKERNRFFKGMCSWIGYNVEWLEYENAERMAGETKWSIRQLLKYAIEGITSFSAAPLFVASFAGGICFFLAILLVVGIAARTLLFGDPVAGWTSTVCIILLVGGIQLLCVGLLGQYVSKMYMETKQRPIYLVKKSNIGN